MAPGEQLAAASSRERVLHGKRPCLRLSRVLSGVHAADCYFQNGEHGHGIYEGRHPKLMQSHTCYRVKLKVDVWRLVCASPLIQAWAGTEWAFTHVYTRMMSMVME